MTDTALEYRWKQAGWAIDTKDGLRFIAANWCKVLELENVRDAVAGFSGDEAYVVSTHQGRERSRMLVLTQPGLTRLMLRTDSPRAAGFQRWVNQEIPKALADGSSKEAAAFILGFLEPPTEHDGPQECA